MAYPETRICPRERNIKSSEIQIDHLIQARRLDLLIVNQKKKTCKIVDFIVLADHRICVKDLKESVNIDTYLNLFGELKEIMNQEGDSCY